MSDLDRLAAALRSSQMLRVCLVGVLTIVLLIPVAMIGGLVSERQERHVSAVEEVSAKWGRAQKLTGPALVIPYAELETSIDGERETSLLRTRHAIFLPAEVEASGHIETEMRERGIFSVPVYGLTASVAGTFDPPDLTALGVDPASVDWERARLVVGVSDVRAINDSSPLAWNGLEADFLPGTEGFGSDPGIHAPVPVDEATGGFSFSFSLDLNGSQSVYWVPFAEETTLRLTSDSPYPSFQGNWLPTGRTVSDDGFEAEWSVSYLGRNYPQAWTSTADVRSAIEASRFGVELGSPVDLYRMAERSVKYAGLLVLLTFAAVWLTEVLAGVRVHPIQYLMLGAALCVFYLLELSLAEHVGFRWSYLAAALSIVAMVASYGRTIFGDWRRAGLPTAGVGVLYTYLFVLLTNEDAALLVGSVGLFLVLAIIMFVTRRIDWYAGTVPNGERTHEAGVGSKV